MKYGKGYEIEIKIQKPSIHQIENIKKESQIAEEEVTKESLSNIL